MKFRPFAGRSGAPAPEVSEVGLGTWQLGSEEWGDVTADAAAKILGTAFDAGVTFFDTADIYGGGVSEQRIADFLSSLSSADRDRVFVATKFGRRGDPGWPENFTRETVTRHTEDSLARLKVDRLDLTQLHCLPLEEIRRGEIFAALRDLKAAGKVARFGASVESSEEAEACLEVEGLDSLQIIFNPLRQEPIGRFFAAAEEKNVAVIVRLPLASGLLTGKFDKSTTFAETDHRTFNRDGQSFHAGETFAGLPFEWAVDFVERMRPILSEDGSRTMAAATIRWILDYAAVTTIIPGATKPEHIAETAAASEADPLPRRVHNHLRSLYERDVKDRIRGHI